MELRPKENHARKPVRFKLVSRRKMRLLFKKQSQFAMVFALGALISGL
jgi:hypothetical protein